MKRPLSQMEMFRAQELLLLRATEGLEDQEAAELAALGADDDLSFELAASAVDLATITIEPIPSRIADKILFAVETANLPSLRMSRDEAQEVPVAGRRAARSTRLAMIAAAASLVIAAGSVVWALRRPTTVVVSEAPEPTAAEARTELLATAQDVTTLAWQPTKDPNGIGARGDVIWSPSAQRGYMRFAGVTPNDGSVLQYQLWIFDKTRDQAFPIDGGVFDIPSTGEVIVPIRAKLAVGEPVLFAVTIEKPGGVVVSKRERIVVTAAPAT